MSQRPRVLIELGAELDRAARGGRRRRSGLRNLPAPSLGGAATLVAVGCALAVAAFAIVALGHRHPSPTTTPQPALSPPAQRNPRDLRDWFAALRRPSRPADRLPPQVSAELARPHLPSGLDRQASRRVISTRNLQVWLVPARRQLCDVEVNSGPRVPADTGFGAGCIGIAGAEKYGLVSSGETFQAVLPDGTSKVKVTFKDGSSILLTPNANGVILYTPKQLMREYSFTSPTGATINQKIVIPPPAPHG